MDTSELNKALFGGVNLKRLFPMTQEEMLKWEEEQHPVMRAGSSLPRGRAGRGKAGRE